MNKIDAIKNALSDPACESVTVTYKDENCMLRKEVKYETSYIFNKAQLIRGNYSKNLSEIESFQINHAQFPDIEEGDTVSTPHGIGEVWAVMSSGDDSGIYVVGGLEVFEGDEQYYTREQIVLLSKGKE